LLNEKLKFHIRFIQRSKIGKCFHFDDVSANSHKKRLQNLEEGDSLHQEGDNIIAFLFYLTDVTHSNLKVVVISTRGEIFQYSQDFSSRRNDRHKENSMRNISYLKPKYSQDFSSRRNDRHKENSMRNISYLKPNYIDDYDKIVETIRLVTPYFDDFILEPSNPSQIKLRWREKNNLKRFSASLISDGTIRFICLCALLLQPIPPNLSKKSLVKHKLFCPPNQLHY
jgi:predicted ATPase